MPTHARSALAALALVALGFATARVLAVGAPVQTPLTYSGTVTDAAGKPYATAVEVNVAFHDAATAGTQKCKSPTVQAEAGTGRFSVELPSACADAVHDKTELWSEAQVGPLKTPMPRVKVGAVPYALEAEQAKVATVAGGGLKAAVEGLQADVAGLKAGSGSGGGGPWVIDAKGVALGALVAQTPYSVTFITSAGYLVSANFSGDFVASTEDVVHFSVPNCAGKPMFGSSLSARPNVFAVYWPGGKQFYVADGPPSGSSTKTPSQYISTQTGNNACSTAGNPGNSSFIPAHAMSLAEMGLANLTPPFGIKL